jgi:hypothetical protein
MTLEDLAVCQGIYGRWKARGAPDLGRYTLAWAAAYLTGDRDEALARLWAVHRAWQGVN